MWGWAYITLAQKWQNIIFQISKKSLPALQKHLLHSFNDSLAVLPHDFWKPQPQKSSKLVQNIFLFKSENLFLQKFEK